VLGWQKEVDIAGLPVNVRSFRGIPDCSQFELTDEGLNLDAYLANIEKQAILKAIEKSGGNRTKAAELLQISFRSIRYRLQKLGVDADEAND